MNGERDQGSDAEAAARREGLEAARRFRLPFTRQAWRGAAGGWQGSGAGSSIDFQDHRAYVPGDDPRHLHWAAYARTGQLTMKLYRAEVSPMVDLVVDASGSMRREAARAARTESLISFCLESAARAGAPVRLHATLGGRIRLVATERVRARGFWTALGAEAETETSGANATGQAGQAAPPPWRAGAMKIWISDLLFPGEPSQVLNAMAAGGGCALVFSPVLAAEAELAERGNIELADHEGGAPRRQRIDDALAERYRAAYGRHFGLWRDAARRAAAGFARVDCAGGLAAALAGEARSQGVVEVLA
jgi:uncharacterized protein (DUF58 family)